MTSRNQATLFPTKEAESSTLTIYCSGCSAKAFKVDEATLSRAGIVSLTCSNCGNGTSLSIAESGNIIIVPGYAEQNLPKRKTRKQKQGENPSV